LAAEPAQPAASQWPSGPPSNKQPTTTSATSQPTSNSLSCFAGRRADGQTGRRADGQTGRGHLAVGWCGRLGGWLAAGSAAQPGWLAAGSAAQPGWLLAGWCLVSVARWLGLGGWLAVWLRVYGCGRWLPRSSGYDKKHGRRSVICVDVPIRGGGKYS